MRGFPKDPYLSGALAERRARLRAREEEPSLDGFFRRTGELFSPFPSVDLGETPAGDALFYKHRRCKISSKTSNHVTSNAATAVFAPRKCPLRRTPSTEGKGFKRRMYSVIQSTDKRCRTGWFVLKWFDKKRLKLI